MKPQYPHSRSILFIQIIIVLLFIGLTSFLVFSFPPDYQIKIYQYNLSIYYPFFTSFFLLIYTLTFTIIRSKKHAFLTSLFCVSYTLLRLNKITHPLFLILLLALFLIIEFLFSKNRNTQS